MRSNISKATDTWLDHFLVESGLLIGKTDIAKGTIKLLEMNTVELILERKLLEEAGFF